MYAMAILFRLCPWQCAPVCSTGRPVYTSVKIDYIVVAYSFPSFLPVPLVDVGQSVLSAFGCGSAVYDYFCDVSHSLIYIVPRDAVLWQSVRVVLSVVRRFRVVR